MSVTAEILTNHILDLARHQKRIDGRGPMITVRRASSPASRRRPTARPWPASGRPRSCAGSSSSRKALPRHPERGDPYDQRRADPALLADVRPGPPHPRAIEVSRVVDRAIRAAETIDLTKLCVTSGEKCWTCFVDVHVLDHSGNLIDAASLAALAALTHTTMPNVRFGSGPPTSRSR